MRPCQPLCHCDLSETEGEAISPVEHLWAETDAACALIQGLKCLPDDGANFQVSGFHGVAWCESAGQQVTWVDGAILSK